jgi:ribose transport system permease protein
MTERENAELSPVGKRAGFRRDGFSGLSRMLQGILLRVFSISRNVVLIYGILVVVFVIASFASPHFLSRQNIINVLIQGVALGIVSLGQTVVILGAGIDLSTGSIVTAVNCIAATIMFDSTPSILLAVLVSLLFGAAVGAVNGIGVVKLKIAPFMMTLASMSAVQGIAFLFRSSPGGYVPPAFIALASRSVGFVPLPVFLLIVLAVLVAVILRVTRFGLHIFATGGNEESARLSGVKVDRVMIATYVISGITAAVAGLFLTARTGAGDPAIGQAYGFDSVTVALLGGTDLFGGQGGIAGTMAGVYIIGVLNNILNLSNVSSYYQWMVKGVILILATAAYTARMRR